MDVKETLSVGHGLQEYTTLSNNSFLKTANCVELHTRSELEDVTLKFFCSDSIALSMLKTTDPSAGAICEILEFNTKTAGAGCTQAAEVNPVAASTHVTFKDAVPVELKEQLSIEMLAGDALDGSTSRPADVPLES